MNFEDKIILNKAFKPIFEKFNQRYVLLTGGRGSGKSFHIAMWALFETFKPGKIILYTRYTLVSAKISIIPEFVQKIEIMNATAFFRIKQDEIINKKTGSKVIFKGLRTSNNDNIANLKSITDVTTVIIDEAQEFTDSQRFDILDLSVRKKTQKNTVIFVMNPTTSKHFLYERFIKNSKKYIKIDETDIEISTHPDVLHIHSTYLDNIDNLSESFLKKIIDLKNEDAYRYRVEGLGCWEIDAFGALFSQKELNFLKEEEFYSVNDYELRLGYIDVADEGKDYFCFVVGGIKNNKAYIFDVIYTQDNIDITEERTIEMIKRYKLDYVRVETNNQGSIFIKNLRKIEGFEDKILGVFNSANKKTRIIQAYATIKRRFVFKITDDAEYNEYLFNILSYKKAEKNEHDDGIDATAGLAAFINSFNLFNE